MQIKELQSWDDFENEIQQLMQYCDEFKSELKYPDILVFRGQRNSAWHLETTLERETQKETYSMRRYFEIIKKAITKLPRPTTFSWEILDRPEYSNWFDNRNFLWLNGLLDYMVYLRHHGFPSPLLDWTKSPEVAAYFAFNDVNSSVESVTIFAFLEHTAGVKGEWLVEPNISRVRPDFPLETRHTRQQSTYTYCSTETEEDIYYSNHEKVFTGNRRNKFPQDVLWKFIIPSNEKEKVLQKLEIEHINTSLLFDSQDVHEEPRFFRDLFKELEEQ